MLWKHDINNPKQIIPNLESCITWSQVQSKRVSLVLHLKGIITITIIIFTIIIIIGRIYQQSQIK